MNVSIVGLGIMGSAIAKRLLDGGHAVTVTNRTRAKAEPLIAAGARWADSPAQAASGADVVITMVTDPKAVIEVTFGESGILSAISSTAVHSEMSTVSPDSAMAVAAEYAKAGRRFVQAPVLGSHQQIEQGTLLVLAGGAAADVEHCRRAWDSFSKRIWALKSVEQACALKLACNMLIASMIVGFGQSLMFARAFDISATDFIDVISELSLAAPMYRGKGDAIVKGSYKPSFVVANLLKDVNLAAEAARAKGARLPVNSIASELLSRAAEAGFANEDYSAVVKILAADSGVTIS